VPVPAGSLHFEDYLALKSFPDVVPGVLADGSRLLINRHEEEETALSYVPFNDAVFAVSRCPVYRGYLDADSRFSADLEDLVQLEVVIVRCCPRRHARITRL